MKGGQALRGTSGFTGAQIVVLFLALAIFIAIPIITHPLPPVSDYVNHLARMHVIATIGSDANIARFYEIDWDVIPNLMMDLVVPVLARAMNIYLAGQIFIIASFVLIAAGTLALNRALIGRWSMLPLISFPLLYNYVFLVGLANYIFGIGLAVWALAVWVWLRGRVWPLRIIASGIFVVLLFFCHFAALGAYGVGLLAYESFLLLRGRRMPTVPAILQFTAGGLPFLLAAALLAVSPTMNLASAIEWDSHGKMDGLAFVIEVYSDVIAFALAGLVVAAAVWAARHRLLQIHPYAWFLLAVGGAVYLALPRVIFATYMADQRVPLALAFMLIACVDADLRRREVRRGFLALLLITLGIRVTEVSYFWSDLSVATGEFRTSVRRIRPGAKVFVSYADRTAGEDVKDLGLVHAACIAMIERSALVTTAFTVVGKQVMHVRPAYRAMVDTEDGTPPSTAQLLVAADHPDMPGIPEFWKNWTQFDYLYVLFTEDEAPNPDPRRLTLIYDGDRFQLYRINRAANAPADATLAPSEKSR
ncbi:MAG TPA: hypothetical protein VHA55_11015 [Pseudorhodoplanes sp.]|nr:hypothetical protein [Pseudorhodoplanes sp.]